MEVSTPTCQSKLIRTTVVLAVLLCACAPGLHAQAIYELNDDGSLVKGSRSDAKVREGYTRQHVFYTLGNDGTLSGTNQPSSVAQEPGEEVVLATSPGRRLEISGNIVNVREGPGLGNKVTTQLERGTQLISLQHSGNWVEVSTPDSDQALGWVYESLLVEVFGYSPAYGNSPAGRFRRELDKLTEAEETRDRFTGLELRSPNVRNSLSLVASDVWLNESAADRWGAATQLGRTWKQLAPGQSAAILNIVNEKGKRQMTVIRP